jgi:hypothetical protein
MLSDEILARQVPGGNPAVVTASVLTAGATAAAATSRDKPVLGQESKASLFPILICFLPVNHYPSIPGT